VATPGISTIVQPGAGAVVLGMVVVVVGAMVVAEVVGVVGVLDVTEPLSGGGGATQPAMKMSTPTVAPLVRRGSRTSFPPFDEWRRGSPRHQPL
jgi:hypothetical protein